MFPDCRSAAGATGRPRAHGPGAAARVRANRGLRCAVEEAGPQTRVTDFAFPSGVECGVGGA